EAVTEDAAPSPASVMAARSAETAADGPMAADARSIPPSASPQPSPEGYAAADARPTVERRRTDATGGIEEAGIAAPPRMQTAQAAPAVGDQGPPADGGGAVAARALVSAGVEAEAAPAAPPPPTPAISNNPRWPDQWLTV